MLEEDWETDVLEESVGYFLRMELRLVAAGGKIDHNSKASRGHTAIEIQSSLPKSKLEEIS